MIAFTGIVSLFDIPFAPLVGLAAAVGAVALFHHRTQRFLWDYHSPSWVIHLVDEPVFIHWCTAVLSAPLILLSVVLVPIGSYFLDREHFSLLTSLATQVPTVAAFIYLFTSIITTYGVLIRRKWLKTKHVSISAANLPKELDGLKIVQLSDIHLGGWTNAHMVQQWINAANEQSADLVVITGDLTISGTEFHQPIAELLSQLRANYGVYVSMGNHDYYGEGEPFFSAFSTQINEKNINAKTLRNQAEFINIKGATLRLAGVDDVYTGRADVEKTMSESNSQAPSFSIVLAHDPDLADRFVERGAQLVLSGHTHGGQVAMPGFQRQLNYLRWTRHHKYTYGLYAVGEAFVYVHGGMGTTGPPIRLGVPPELAVITLRRP